MSLWGRLRGHLDPARYRPAPGETRVEFLSRMGRDGLPALGYAEVLRSPVWELCREVTKLRAEVDALQSELAALRSRAQAGPQPDQI